MEALNLRGLKGEKMAAASKFIVAGVLFLLLLVSACSSRPKADYSEFAKCLTAKDVKMYGAYWCSSCDEQKELFGDSFKYVTYVECAVRGSSVQAGTCKENSIQGYPTWVFADGSRAEGLLPLAALASRSGCELLS